MIQIKSARFCVLAAALCLACLAYLAWPVQSAFAESEPAAQVESMRAEVAKPVSEAQALLDAKKYAEALSKAAEADAVPNKNSHELYAVELVRGNTLLSSGEKAKAVKAFELASSTNFLKGKDQLTMTQAIAQLHFETSNYPSTITWTKKYLADGGPDPKMKIVLYQAQYLNKDYPEALKGINEQVQSDVSAGRVPTEQDLKLAVSCLAMMKDKAASVKAIEQLNTYYPTAKNWLYLIDQMQAKPNTPERTYLEIYRLKQELGLMESAAEFVDMANIATKLGLPAEAKKALQQGFAVGILDKGADAKKNLSLKNAAEKRAADDVKTMQQDEAGANKAKDGAALANLGMAYATAGQFEKGATLINQGITKGMPRIEEAKLHLGIVYFWAGKKEEAIKQLSSIQGSDSTADLARYWTMQINRPLSK